jgi:ribosomal protein S18 acetylase RimI-like enzyme
MIRQMTFDDFTSFWPTFSAVLQAQETYAFDPQWSLDQAFEVWCKTPQKTFAFIDGGDVLGSYYIKPNAAGPSKHICNCGYMVAATARGKGLARTMCEHSQAQAVEMGFTAMQFNSVVSTNTVAVRLWQSMGFEVIGTIPNAYQHGTLGFVDSHIMYKAL